MRRAGLDQDLPSSYDASPPEPAETSDLRRGEPGEQKLLVRLTGRPARSRLIVPSRTSERQRVPPPGESLPEWCMQPAGNTAAKRRRRPHPGRGDLRSRRGRSSDTIPCARTAPGRSHGWARRAGHGEGTVAATSSTACAAGVMLPPSRLGRVCGEPMGPPRPSTSQGEECRCRGRQASAVGAVFRSSSGAIGD